MIRSRRFFYVLIVLAVVAALFYSTFVGLIILIAAIVYYYVLGRRIGIMRASALAKSASEPKEIQTQPSQTACKRCNTMFDSASNTSCPSCGAPVEV